MFGAILTHRGIDIPLGTSPSEVCGESTWEAFSSQVRSGYGLEFDIQPTKDGGFAISHDADLRRITKGCTTQKLSEISTKDIAKIQANGGRLCDLDELLDLLTYEATSISALHLKYQCQTPQILDLFSGRLQPFMRRLEGKLMVFDARPESAARLKEHIPELSIAASVSHPYDVERYGAVTGHTLLTADQAISHSSLYNWVWLDEWDRLDSKCSKKTLVTVELVQGLRSAGFKVAVVSPELHSTSPSLLGSESHEDAASVESLKFRLSSWGYMQLEVICTDHASAMGSLFKSKM
jgi:glycerophosphoryl diester phosphodiesterase